MLHLQEWGRGALGRDPWGVSDWKVASAAHMTGNWIKGRSAWSPLWKGTAGTQSPTCQALVQTLCIVLPALPSACCQQLPPSLPWQPSVLSWGQLHHTSGRKRFITGLPAIVPNSNLQIARATPGASSGEWSHGTWVSPT